MKTYQCVLTESGQVYLKLIDDIQLLDRVFQAQKSVVEQNKNIISTASNKYKGNFGEIGSDVYLTLRGDQPLHIRLTDINASIHQGIDGVF